LHQGATNRPESMRQRCIADRKNTPRSMHDSRNTRSRVDHSADTVSIRKIPYPYRAALAICSDLDETPDRKVYFEIAKFLNTAEMTQMGCGVNLELGNTIYFDMPADQFSYWNTDDAGRSMIHACIQSGHIDCLHSYGDNAISREHAEKALNELSRRNSKLEVWVDHSVAPTNFGADIMQGRGDIPGSKAYHADLSCEFGIRFVWRGRVTSVIGQDSVRSLKGIWDRNYALASSKTLLKEFLKGIAANFGSSKYALHKPNQVLREVALRDGRRVYEFLRANPHHHGVSCGETADGIGEVLVPRFLDRLVQTGGICILYTHLGKISNHPAIFTASAITALRRLSEYFYQGKILVTTTRKILKYCLAVRDLSMRVESQNGSYSIILDSSFPDQLEGLTLYSPDPEKSVVTINGRGFDRFNRNPPDLTGRRSISLPWKRLNYPRM
jgi:hypothetical protein